MIFKLVKNINISQQNVYQLNRLIPAVLFHTNTAFFVNKQEKTPEEDDFDIQRKQSAMLKNLERLGTIKNHISWPQYNRIIYPPNEDGKTIRNPVNNIKFILNLKNLILA